VQPLSEIPSKIAVLRRIIPQLFCQLEEEAMQITEPRSKRQIHKTRSPRRQQSQMPALATSRLAVQCRKKFLRFFPDAFADPTYHAWERDYKDAAARRWQSELNQSRFAQLLKRRAFDEIARAAITIESRTNLLFSFEKMALRDAVRTADGAKTFSIALFDWLHGVGDQEDRFSQWIEAVQRLPRRQTRVLTWPLVTVFGFIAKPDSEIFLKPMVTRRAAEAYDFPFEYQSSPNWETYQSLLDFASAIRADCKDLRPQDMIDIQSFIWVQGSDEYD
jgi:hypothetical protein